MLTCSFDGNATRGPLSSHMLLMSQKYLYVVELMRQVSHDVPWLLLHSDIADPTCKESVYLRPKVVSHLA